MDTINAILAKHRIDGSRGAPMGAEDVVGDLTVPLSLQKVMLNSGYAADGTYWGWSSKTLWCAYSEDTRIYRRAETRQEAIAILKEVSHLQVRECR